MRQKNSQELGMGLRRGDRAPAGSAILEGMRGAVDYMDSYRVDVADNADSIDYLTALILEAPSPLADKLLRMRDAIVRPFGLKTDHCRPGQSASCGSAPSKDIHYGPGDVVGLFHVIARMENEIVMGEDDRHLYFRVSVYSERHPETNTRSVFLTTVVQFHNLWGRVYFTPVKPFHGLIVRGCLRGFAKVYGK